MSRKSLTPDAAFTLIELLVVISIIAILAALILSVVTRSREPANRSACISNLRNVHVLLARFAAENDGAIPIGYRLGQKQFNTTLYSASGNKHVLLGRLISAGLVDDPPIFFCPAERDRTQAWDTKENPWPLQPGKNLQGGYACNPIVDWGTAESPPVWPRLASLDRIPLLADGVGMPKRVDSRHRDGINVIYSDGDARWIPRERFDADLAGCTSLGAGNNAAQQRIWETLAGQR